MSKLKRFFAERAIRVRDIIPWLAGLLTTYVLFAPAAAAADDKDQYRPGGIGDMMPSPIKPDGQGTMFETYSAPTYSLDVQLADDYLSGDFGDKMANNLVGGLMWLLIAVGRAAVVITQWTFKVVSIPEIEDAIARAIEGAAQPMVTTLMPSALAVGAFIAWAKRGESSVVSQLAWVCASAAIATTLLVSPSTWVKGVDEGRQFGASISMSTLGSSLSGSTESAMPFQTPEPAWGKSEADNTLRKASDSVWRTYVATPWCVADLGSVAACKKWGKQLADNYGDMKKREEFLKKTLNTETVGEEAVKWRQGHNPAGRIGILLTSLICVAIFAAMMITLAFATLASLLGALMLLVCGVGFAALWCIPGKPRQWGVAWFEALFGMVMMSFTSTMLMGSVLIMSTVTLSLMPTYGWLMVCALNIAVALVAVSMKSRLEGIVSASGVQMGGRGIISGISNMTRARRLRRVLRRRRGEGGPSRRRPRDDGDSDSDSGSDNSERRGPGNRHPGSRRPPRPTPPPPPRPRPEPARRPSPSPAKTPPARTPPVPSRRQRHQRGPHPEGPASVPPQPPRPRPPPDPQPEPARPRRARPPAPPGRLREPPHPTAARRRSRCVRDRRLPAESRGSSPSRRRPSAAQ
ncbi:hypothetical protein AB0N09_30885 [Streptomyces erythrochromogenes]|uniref:hypothetical protein n=1 Tax=Streptomyces erythrochromogenes TaxID=285574 RepID=UPI00342625DF